MIAYKHNFLMIIYKMINIIVLQYILIWIIVYFIYKLILKLDELDSSLYSSLIVLFVLMYCTYYNKNNVENLINISSQTDNRNIREEPRFNINASVKCNSKQSVINHDVLTRSDVDYDFNNYSEPIENIYFLPKDKKDTYGEPTYIRDKIPNDKEGIKNSIYRRPCCSGDELRNKINNIDFDKNFGGKNNDSLDNMLRVDLGESINRVYYEDLRYN